MRPSVEFASLLTSAADLGIPHEPSVRYVSRQTVLRGLRFHFTEWGDPAAPAVLLLHGGNQSSHSWDLVSLHLVRPLPRLRPRPARSRRHRVEP